jgi:hypothetical protein
MRAAHRLPGGVGEDHGSSVPARGDAVNGAESDTGKVVNPALERPASGRLVYLV